MGCWCLLGRIGWWMVSVEEDLVAEIMVIAIESVFY